ncbi:MAG: hypothetical protein AAF696_11455 [Bacteroidota bacterium]
MKSFFNHALLILAVIAICCLAIFFRGQLLAGYERTQLSVPSEAVPTRSVPIPASIRSYKEEKTEILPAPISNRQNKVSWKAQNISDFADAPLEIQKRIKENIRKGSEESLP